MTTNQDLHEQVAAYALDALDGDERRAYEAHLAGCEQCRAELAGLTETAGALGLATSASDPAPGLRDRILDTAREEGPSNVVAIGSSRRRWYAAAAVAAAAAVGLAIGLSLALSGGGSPSNKIAASVSVDNGVATVSGFRDAPAGKAYEIWVIEGTSAPKPAGLFTETGESVRLTRPAPVGSTVAVTLEPAGGSAAPTSRIRARTIVQA